MVLLEFQNVPVKKVEEVHPLLVKTLRDVVDSGIDPQRMEVIIDRRISELLLSVESDPHEAITGMLIGNFLYGEGEEDVSAIYF